MASQPSATTPRSASRSPPSTRRLAAAPPRRPIARAAAAQRDPPRHPMVPMYPTLCEPCSEFQPHPRSWILRYNLSVGFRVRNPNRRIAIHYHAVAAQALYEGQRFADAALPDFFQDTGDTTLFAPAFAGRSPLLGGAAAADSRREATDGARFSVVVATSGCSTGHRVTPPPNQQCSAPPPVAPFCTSHSAVTKTGPAAGVAPPVHQTGTSGRPAAWFLYVRRMT
ncbi:hypothetical protein ACP70R_020729 [Stipagrostis hirtigluma subsp. patula]